MNARTQRSPPPTNHRAHEARGGAVTQSESVYWSEQTAICCWWLCAFVHDGSLGVWGRANCWHGWGLRLWLAVCWWEQKRWIKPRKSVLVAKCWCSGDVLIGLCQFCPFGSTLQEKTPRRSQAHAVAACAACGAGYKTGCAFIETFLFEPFVPLHGRHIQFLTAPNKTLLTTTDARITALLKSNPCNYNNNKSEHFCSSIRNIWF